MLAVACLAASALLQSDCGPSTKGGKIIQKGIEAGQDSVLAYYATQSVVTDPGRYESLYKNLPSDISTLCKVTQSILLHIFHAQRYGVTITKERAKEVTFRKVEDMLGQIQKLDNRLVASPREPIKRLIANCRGYSVFISSLLRYNSISARPRCGFATYYTLGKYEDHWICEYWNSEEKRWVQFDPQIDSVIKSAFNIEFNPQDMPKGKFLPAGDVWKLCRSGELDPSLCGIAEMNGIWFVRDNLIRDFMCLNKLELMPWDCNELMDRVGQGELNSQENNLLDKVASLTTDNNTSFSKLRSSYQSESILRMPAEWKP